MTTEITTEPRTAHRNIIPKIGRFWVTIICAVVGVGLSSYTGVYENIPKIVTEIGYAFVPVGGILCGHFVLLSRWCLDLVSLYNENGGSYRYVRGVNPIAIVIGVAGYFVASSQVIPANWMTEVSVAILTGLVYAGAMKVAAQFWAPARDSFDYASMKDHYDEFEVNEQLLKR